MKYVISILIAFILIGCDLGTSADYNPPSRPMSSVGYTLPVSSSSVYIMPASSSSQIIMPSVSSSSQESFIEVLEGLCDNAWMLMYTSKDYNNLNDFCTDYKEFILETVPEIRNSDLAFCIAREECTGYTEREPTQTQNTNSSAYESCMKTCNDAVCNSASGAAMGRSSCSSIATSQCSAGCASLR